MKTIVALLLIASPLAFARLGDSPEECARQYGKPTTPPVEDSGYTLMGYERKGVIVSISYKNGKAVSVDYSRPGKPYNEREIQEILRKEAGPGINWEENLNPAIAQSGIGRIWIVSARDRTASVNKKATSIIFRLNNPSASEQSKQ